MKRIDYISWNALFMGIAKLASQRSKDPRTQHGACIVDIDNKIVSVGYNGFPSTCSDDDFSWDRKDKHNYVIHAEMNALLNTTAPLKGCKLYLYSKRGYYPCVNGCAQAICQVGITDIVLNTVETPENDAYDGSHAMKMFNASNISVEVLEYNGENI